MIDILLTQLALGAVGAFLLLVWFNTQAFVEYTKLFWLDQLFRVDAYSQVSINDASKSYPQFIVEYYPNFFTKLLSCPACLAVWFAAALNIVCFVGFAISLLPSLLAIALLPFVYPLAVCATSYCSLFLYSLLVILQKKTTI